MVALILSTSPLFSRRSLNILDMLEDVLQGVLAEDEEIVVLAAKPVCTHLQLVGALLTADVEDAFFRQAEHRLQREGGLADARLTAEEHDRARYETTTEHAVQFLVVQVDARIVVIGDFAQSEGSPDGSGG